MLILFGCIMDPKLHQTGGGGGGGADLKISLIHVWAVCSANSFFFVYCCFHCGLYAPKSFTFCDMSTTFLGDGSNKGARQKK